MKTNLRICSVLLPFLLVISAAAQPVEPPGLSKRPVTISAPGPGQTLTLPSTAAPATVMGDYLRGRGASAATVQSLRETSDSRPGANGVTHLRLEQQVGGLTIVGTYIKAAVNNRGELIHLIESLVPVPAGGPAPAVVNELQALTAAFAVVHPGEPLDVRPAGRNGKSAQFAGGPFFHSDPTVTQVAIPADDGSLQAGFLVQTWTKRGNLLHHTIVDGQGQVLSVELRTANDSYNVFIEDPLKDYQAVVVGPAPNSANPISPLGWLGSGPQTTLNISGNNVNAYLDADGNNRADRGGSSVTTGNFLTIADLNAAPTTTGNRAVAVQNLFYFNNQLHDILYAHGFNESAGNFQVNNFGKGGAGNDPVLAEAQDGSGMDNANFATPLDGQKPRMQMYLWTGVGATHEVKVNSPTLTSFDATPAQFGPALSTTGLTGNVVNAIDGLPDANDGCQTFTSVVRGQIALVNRGACDFIVKVLNAQNAGAIGVIVANNVDSPLFTMGGIDRRIKIPSVLVSKADGDKLRAASGLNVTLRKKLQQPLNVDGDLDSDIVFHEYGHGLTWRMIGKMSGPLAGAIGEGASDALACLLNGDDRIGEYSSGDPLGIRSHPYAGYKGTYSNVTGAQVHADGEVFAAIIWRLKELFATEGIPVTTLLDDFVRGMNFTKESPAFEDMRDGMLQAAAPEHRCLIWRAFAQFGVGVGASGVVKSSSSVTVTPSTTLPAGCP